MNGESATAVITDPPFNIPIAGHVSGLGKNKHADFAMGVGEMSFDEFKGFLQTSTTLYVKYLATGALIYTFMDRRHLEELLWVGRHLGLKLLDLCIWNKDKGGMGGVYRSQHEPCVVFKSGASPHINNVKLGVFGRNRTNVWTHPGMGSFGKGREEALAAHPTVKPWPLLAEIIKDCSYRGDIVLDPFLGSGSTLLAAEKTGRRCYGIELEAKYIEVVIARWEKLTNGKAVHEGTGFTLAELRHARLASAQSKTSVDAKLGGQS
jgi:DNA modification methylase